MFWMTIAMRFVPFARAESSPRKISTGKVNDEPPPAITLITPEITPTEKRRSAEVMESNRV